MPRTVAVINEKCHKHSVLINWNAQPDVEQYLDKVEREEKVKSACKSVKHIELGAPGRFGGTQEGFCLNEVILGSC